MWLRFSHLVHRPDDSTHELIFISFSHWDLSRFSMCPTGRAPQGTTWTEFLHLSNDSPVQTNPKAPINHADQAVFISAKI